MQRQTKENSKWEQKTGNLNDYEKEGKENRLGTIIKRKKKNDRKNEDGGRRGGGGGPEHGEKRGKGKEGEKSRARNRKQESVKAIK